VEEVVPTGDHIVRAKLVKNTSQNIGAHDVYSKVYLQRRVNNYWL